MDLNWKRILLLIGFIAAVILIGYGLYFVFLRPTVPTTTTPPTNATNTGGGGLPSANTGTGGGIVGNINGSLPGTGTTDDGQPRQGDTTIQPSQVAQGGLTQTSAVSDDPVFRPTLSSNGNMISYYDRGSGKFYQITADGRTIPLSDKVFFEVQDVTWAPNKSVAVLEYPDGANIVYDFATEKQFTLPDHWKDFSFSPNSERLVLKSIGTGNNRWLAVSSSDGSGAVRIENLGDKDATVHPNWSPNGSIVAMYTEDLGFDQQRLFFLGLNDENFKSTVIEGRGFQGKWSDSGDTLLYSVYSSDNDYNPTLWIVDAAGENIGEARRSLNLETWANNCSFASNTTIYCAVPQTLSEGTGIFGSESNFSPSDIYKIDLSSGARTRIAIPEQDAVVENIIVDSNQSQLYYTDKIDGRLYTIRLQ